MLEKRKAVFEQPFRDKRKPYGNSGIHAVRRAFVRIPDAVVVYQHDDGYQAHDAVQRGKEKYLSALDGSELLQFNVIAGFQFFFSFNDGMRSSSDGDPETLSAIINM